MNTHKRCMHKRCILFIYAGRSIHASMQEVMSVWAEYAELQSLSWQWLDQCTKMYLAWCCSSWSQALDADHYKRWWSWTFTTHFTKMQSHETHPRIQSQIHIKKLSIITLVAEALGRLWGRSFPTSPQIYRLQILGMIYILKKCCMAAHAACWIQSLGCIARIQTYTTTYANSCPNSRANPTQLRMELWNGTMKCCVEW